MSGKYPALGFDPAPGSIGAITDLADGLGTIAEQLGEAHTDLTRIGKSDGVWRGDAATAFAETVEDLPEYLDKAHGSFTDAASALRGWAEDVESMQRKAVDFEEDAARALADLKSAQANPDLGLAGQSFQQGPALQQAQAALDRAEAAVTTAREKLEQIREDAADLLKQHMLEGAKVAKALNKAREAAPDAPLIDIGGLLDSIGDALSSIADTLAQIGDVLSALGNVLGVLALATSWIPGVNAVTAAAAAGVSALAAGTKMLAKAGGADVSWGSIAMDGVGAIPGGRALAGAKNAATQAGLTAAKKTAGFGPKTIHATSRSRGLDDAPIEQITAGALKNNPATAMRDAAEFAHVQAVNRLNKLPGVNLDPFSTAGMAAGTTFRGGIGFGLGEARREATDRAFD